MIAVLTWAAEKKPNLQNNSSRRGHPSGWSQRTGNVARTVQADMFGGKDKVRSLAEDSNFASVTLEVDPNQAQELALVMNNGDNVLMLSLRNNDDTVAEYKFNLVNEVLGPDASRFRSTVKR